MVKRVAAPEEYRLLIYGRRNYPRFAMETLKQFSTQKLLESKIVTKNFKAGFDFNDSYVSKITHNKFGRMIVGHMLKEIPFINYTNTYEEAPCVDTDSRNTWIKFALVRDPSIARYVRVLNSHLIKQKMPYAFTFADGTVTTGVTANGTYQTEPVTFVYFQSVHVAGTTMAYYKSLYFITHMMKIIRTLSRKAYFRDETLRSTNRSLSAIRASQPSTQGVGSDRAGDAQVANPAPVV